MKDLNAFVIPKVATKWYELGLKLLETEYVTELDNIEANFKTDVKRCCTEMFKNWLETQSDASWDQLIQAMKNMGLNSVAISTEHFIQRECLAMILICMYR